MGFIRYLYVKLACPRYMAEKIPSKQISIRFPLSDWNTIVQESELKGLKPVQYVRSIVRQYISGDLIDAKSIDAYIQQQKKSELINRRGH